MSFLLQYLLELGAFVESGVVHDDNAVRGEFGDKILFNPRIKDGCVDVAVEETDGEENGTEEGSDDVCSSLFPPVMRPPTALSTGGMSWANPLSSIKTIGLSLI